MRVATLRGFRKRVPHEIIEPVIAAGLNIETAMAAFGQVAGRDYFKMMGRYHGPVLILNGEADELSRKGEEKLRAALQHGYLEIIPDAGHLLNLEQPHAFNQTLRVFLQKILAEEFNNSFDPDMSG